MEDYSGWIINSSFGKKYLRKITEGSLIRFEKCKGEICLSEEEILLTDSNWGAIGYLNLERVIEQEGKLFSEYVLQKKFNSQERVYFTNLIQKTYKNE